MLLGMNDKKTTEPCLHEHPFVCGYPNGTMDCKACGGKWDSQELFEDSLRELLRYALSAKEEADAGYSGYRTHLATEPCNDVMEAVMAADDRKREAASCVPQLPTPDVPSLKELADVALVLAQTLRVNETTDGGQCIEANEEALNDVLQAIRDRFPQEASE